MIMKFDYREAAKKNVLIVAHRGVSGGNIPCNTMAAYEIALMQGADVIEMDVDMSADGQLVVFHPGREFEHLSIAESFENATWDDISRYRYVNAGERCPTQFGVLKLDDFLENFKDRCFINVDKFWEHPNEIYQAIHKHNMDSQVIVKSAPSDEVFRVLEEVAPHLQFMPIVSEENTVHEILKTKKLNYIGAEVLFTSDESKVASDEFIEMMHKDNKLVWANAIIYNYREQLAAGHSDDTALTESMDKGWGWLSDKGFDFIQTDWPLMLIDYLKKTNRYYR
ncbi:MAG: glycerophosphodiester phosphodiesterase family protein [Ruminococcaceae bacterium]|nr:glycerophosphodiester phosphodiesterase family protein [Oscillospiraceae bacterium]